MTGRERIENILSRRPIDRLAWTTLADAETRSVMPAGLRDMPVLDFYRHVGCDVLQFGNYGLPEGLRAAFARLERPAELTVSTVGRVTARRTATAWGELTATFRNGHPVKYPVETIEELRILKRLWADSHYEELPDAAASGLRSAGAVGDDGLYLPTLAPSPVQQLIELDMGLAQFHFLLQDHRSEMEELMAIMHDRRRQEYEIVARAAPSPGLIAVENTSTTLLSPEIYRRYSLPHVRDYADIAHAHGRKLILHMCGHLRNLLTTLAETGMDAVNALTPPPVGDCPFEHALDVLGEDLVILGGIFPPEVLHRPAVTPEEIHRALDTLYTPRIRRANFLLWVAVDGLPTPIERFQAVADWFDRNGGR